MKKHVAISLPVLALSLLTNDASAAFDDYAEKPFSIGMGTYATVITYDDSSIKDDDYSGYALSFGYAFSDQLAMRLNYFDQEHDDNADLTSKGFDVLGYLGTGLSTMGFKAYIGGGLFRDKQEFSSTFFSTSKTFSGLQLSGGIGYNWASVSLDFIINIRSPSDYEDEFKRLNPTATNTDIAIGTGSLQLSYRF